MDNYSLEVERLLKQHKKHGTMDYASRFKDRIIDLYRISHEGAVNEIKKLNNCKEARREKGSFHSRVRLSEEARELNYREMVIRSFDFDPLMCSKCGDRMAIDLEMCYIPEL